MCAVLKFDGYPYNKRDKGQVAVKDFCDAIYWFQISLLRLFIADATQLLSINGYLLLSINA